MEKFYFVMPAYNESENIKETIRQWYPIVEMINKTVGCEAVLAIANDGSKDDTGDVMRRMKVEEDLKYFEDFQKNYPEYLDYDSYVDCGVLFAISFETLKAGEYFGVLNQNDITAIFDILETTKAISTKDKKRFNIRRR
jgi:glycosyltransferase involved in cell wall biosynthesis